MGIIDPTQYANDQEQLAKQRESELDAELGEVRDKDEAKIPDKYKGKSLEEVIQMHEEAERKASRLGNEIGQLRQQVLQRPTKAEEPKKKEVNVDTLLENPEDSIEAVIEQSPVVRKLNETVESVERDIQKRKFESKHTEYQKDLNDEQFFEWIKKNPVRVGLAQSADAGDFQAADLLWDMWAEVKEVRQVRAEQEKVEAKKKREKALQDGTLESGTGNTTESKKVFRRSEIQNLKTRAKLGDRQAQAIVEDPTWQQEVLRAYEQKRVI